MRALPVYPEPPKLLIEETAPAALNSACQACPLYEGVHTVCMPAEAYGEGEALLVIGLYPGAQEDRAGRPNVGASGAYLREQLARVWQGSVVMDNALRCMPGARKVKPNMVAACRPYGASVWQSARPSRVLCLGSEAASSVLGRAVPPFSSRRGYAYASDGTPVFFLIHPVVATRNRFVRGWFEEDLEWAVRALPPKPPADALAFMVTTPEEAEEAAFDLRCSQPFSWDFETFGAPLNDEFALLNLSLTPAKSRYAFVLDRAALETPEVFAPIRKVLESSAIRKGGQNIKFDEVCARAKGVHVRGADFDTMLQRALLDSEAEVGLDVTQVLVGMRGGKEDAHEYVDAGVKELRRLVRAKKAGKPAETSLFQPTWEAVREAVKLREAVRRVELGDEPKRYAYAAIPAEPRAIYNATDTISTDRLRELTEQELARDPEIRRVWEQITLPLHRAVVQMEVNGIAASREKVLQLQEMCQAQIDDLQVRMAAFGPFNPNSQPEVVDLLFNRLGFKPREFTEGGKPSVAADVLEKMNHPAAQAILKYRRASRFKSQYADGMEFFIRDDGRIHPNIKINGTATGRPSCVRRGTLIEVVRDVSKYPMGTPIEDVRPGDLAYSYTSEGELVLRKVLKAWSTGKKALVRVHWQGSGHQHTGYVDLTPDHLVQLKTGEWRAAGQLQPKDRVMALARGIRSGYGRLWAVGREIQREHRFIFEQVYGWLPEHVHHDNYNKLDNQIGNLVGMSSAQHLKLHGAETPASLREFRRQKLLKQYADGLMPAPVGAANSRYLGLSRERVAELLGANSWSITKAARAGGYDWATFKAYAAQYFDLNELKQRSMVLRVKARWNHEVLSVEVLAETDEVFDLTIEETHCFIAGQLCVHNCVEPNLMNIPRAETEDGVLCRDIFVAPPGKLLVELDQSQIEIRVAAMLSGDEAMLECFKSGEDFHLATARLIAPLFKLDPRELTKEHPLRSRSKTINFGVLYGKNAEGLAAELGISVKEAQAIVDAILGRFRKLKQWIGESLAFGRRNGFCRTWWDGQPARRRPLTDILSPEKERRETAERSSWNTPIQGTAADFTNASLGVLHDWIEKSGIAAKLVLTVYDSVLFEVDEVVAAMVVREGQRVMESWNSNGVPLLAEAKVGRAWGSLMSWEKWVLANAA